MSIPALLVAVAAAIRAADFMSRDMWLPGAVWAAAALACVLHDRLGPAVVVAVAAWTLLDVQYYNHVTFIFWVAATLVLFPGEQRRALVFRWQLAILYGFAALAKLNGDWLSGAVLAAESARLPEVLLQPAAVGAVAAELVLAGALWSRRARVPVLWVGACVHLGFWLLMGTNVLWSPGLAPFNVLAFGVLVWSTAPSRMPPASERPLASSG